MRREALEQQPVAAPDVQDASAALLRILDDLLVKGGVVVPVALDYDFLPSILFL